MTVLCGLAVAVLLVLCGVGIGAVGATVIGLGGPGETWGALASGGVGKTAGEKAEPTGAGAAGSEDMSDAAPAAARKPKTPRASQPPRPPRAGQARTTPRAPQSPRAPRTAQNAQESKNPEAPQASGIPRTPQARSAPSLPARTATLGVEVVDAPRGPGALVVGVHVPGPGHSVGLVRGDTLLALGGSRIGSAAGLAARVAALRPGEPVTLTVRHATGERQILLVRPGVVT
ncbi:PDZ domain-containing protein [Streptomyces alfalfae]|uniref:PDZ domain-containing protein n=1 Tax=Streptomyces alfalfae TaxID=1642299 RepID=UPI001FD3EE62|nr:PDZ domain-containing protein [Streptomyces alfalfae]